MAPSPLADQRSSSSQGRMRWRSRSDAPAAKSEASRCAAAMASVSVVMRVTGPGGLGRRGCSAGRAVIFSLKTAKPPYGTKESAHGYAKSLEGLRLSPEGSQCWKRRSAADGMRLSSLAVTPRVARDLRYMRGGGLC